MPVHEPTSPSPQRPQVFINGRFFGQRVTGVQRYARETIQALDELLGEAGNGDIAWTVLAPAGTRLPAFRHLQARSCGRWQGHLWEQLDLAWYSRGGLLLNFGLTGPVLKRRQIVTVHDAAVVRMPQSFRLGFRLWYRWVITTIARRAPRTIAVSRFSAQEAVACFGVPQERLRVATEGWQHLERTVCDSGIVERHGLRDQPFALAASSPTANKNFAAIARAVEMLGDKASRCVVVGAADKSVFRAERSGSDALTWVGYVSDAELKALYEAATCFVFPSFYEGFGIPPLEAMASGCPVLASTAPAVREVCGDAALYFDPSEPRELADRLSSLFGDRDLQATLRAAGLRRAAMYSWRRAAQINLGVVRDALVSAGVPMPAVAMQAEAATADE